VIRVTICILLIAGLYQTCKVTDDNHYSKSTTASLDHNPSRLGVCWVAGDSITNHNFDQLKDVHANWISQTPFAWQPDIHGPEIHLNNDRAWWGEADRGLIHTTQIAQEEGIKVMLKPHIWLRSANGKWRSDLEMKNEEDWDIWFNNYEIMIMHYAELAQSMDIESLCIGTELHLTTKHHPEKWRAIIHKIRDIYDGELTYAANWYKEYEDITFWDELDYIGIQAYFPLSTSEEPSKEELLQNWEKHKHAMKKVADKYNKKIVFTEIGYKNTADSAIEPWTWPQKMDRETVKQSDQTQINLYEAMFEALYYETWVDGFFIWKWFNTTHKHKDFAEYFKAREARYDSLRRVRNRPERPNVYFTPQRTKAIDVLRDWYGKNLSE